MWDEAEGVIALASTGNSDKEEDAEEQPRGRQRDSDISGLSAFNDDFADVFEDENRKKTSFERLGVRHMKSHSTSSTDSRRGSGIPRSDPVAMARSVMERVQRSSTDSLYGSNPSTMTSNDGALQFDTKMLGPLLEKVKKLLSGLENSLKSEGYFGDFGVLSRESLVGA